MNSKKRIVSILLVLIAMHLMPLLADNAKLPEGYTISFSDDNPYVGDTYILKVKVDWKGVVKEKTPHHIEYLPPEGRKVISVERSDDLKFMDSNKFSSGKTVFLVNIMVEKPSEKTEAIIKLFGYTASDKESVGIDYTIQDNPVREKIFNRFTKTEMIIYILILIILIIAVYIIIKKLRERKKSRLQAEAPVDRRLLELNAMGRLLDINEIEQFINQAKQFIKDLFEIRHTDGETKTLESIEEQDLKRAAQRTDKLLHDASFSGKALKKDELEEIYKTCESLYKYNKTKFEE